MVDIRRAVETQRVLIDVPPEAPGQPGGERRQDPGYQHRQERDPGARAEKPRNCLTKKINRHGISVSRPPNTSPESIRLLRPIDYGVAARARRTGSG
jgi:hypothetical protein